MLGYSREQIRRAESLPLAQGEPLMRRAAYALALVVVGELRHRVARLGQGRVAVLVGGGNNGGDGLHAAADLRRRGVDVTAILVRADVHAAGLARARGAGVRIISYDSGGADSSGADSGQADSSGAGPSEHRASEPGWSHYCRRADIWVDALAGIGASGGLRGPAGQIVAELNAMRDGHCVIAVDTPSGIDADSGALAGEVLRADRTVTFGAAKAGLLLPPAALDAGEVTVAEIGLAERLRNEDAEVVRLDGADCARWWPRASRTSHKYTRGVVGLLAGSTRFPGAGLLTSGAAVALGPGMVRYLGPTPVAEMVTREYPQVVSDPGRVQTLVIGPGMPSDEAFDGVANVIEAASPGAIAWDAGALNFLPAHRDYLARYPSILTPHAGEAAELAKRCGLEASRAEIEADPARWARALADELGATVLLKGPVTVVAGAGVNAGPGAGSASGEAGDDVAGAGVNGQQQELYAQADGSQYLATAGSGDVLAGILGALWAQVIAADGPRPTPAPATVAAAAALLHGRASRIAAGQDSPAAPAHAAGEAALARHASPASQMPLTLQTSTVCQGAFTGSGSPAGHPFTLAQLLAVIPVANAAIAAAKPAPAGPSLAH